MQFNHAGMGPLGGFFQRFPNLMGNRAQALFEGFGKSPLLGLEPVGQVGLGAGLAFGHLGETAYQFGKLGLIAAFSTALDEQKNHPGGEEKNQQKQRKN